MIIIIYRCAAGFEEATTPVAVCAEVSSDGGTGDGESADGESADEESADEGSADKGCAKAGERRLCVYLFLIYAYTLIFWAMKRKNEI